jgi:uncharacterized membrane protein
MVPAIFFYDVVLAVHISAIVLAFGVTFAYPILMPYIKGRKPDAMPAVHGASERIGRFLIAPAGVLALISGAYMASDRDLFDQTWVIVPLFILLLLLAAGGLFFGPIEKRLEEVAERDLASDGKLGPEYEALFSRLALAGAIGPALVLVAIFFMAAKPFAG